MNKDEVLKGCTVEGNIIKLPEGQLDRKIYMEVKKSLEGIGGKWKGGKTAGFVFESDPTGLLIEIQGGKAINLKKDFQFFATPDRLADRLVELADAEPGFTYLEPSAGRASIVKAIMRATEQDEMVDCIEMMSNNIAVLEKMPNVTLKGTDFLKTTLKEKYDRIIANPPFTKGQDLEHFRKMYTHLDPDMGVLVSIMSIGWMVSTTKKAKAFRDWLDSDGVFILNWNRFNSIGSKAGFERKDGSVVTLEMIDAGEFKESGTNVRTMIIKLDNYPRE